MNFEQLSSSSDSLVDDCFSLTNESKENISLTNKKKTLNIFLKKYAINFIL